MYFDRNMPPFDDSCYPPPIYEGYDLILKTLKKL